MLTPAILHLSPLAALGLVAVLIAGGSAKGALGIGLPLVSVPLGTQFLQLPAVVVLLTIPMVATNVVQAMEGGRTWPVLQRLWPMMIALVFGTLAGVHLLLSIDRRVLQIVVGSALVLLAALMLAQPQLRLSRSTERWIGPLVGLFAGVLGGLSGMFGPPMIAYLVGIGLPPDAFVKYVSILFLAATGTLLLALGGAGSLSLTDLAISGAAMIPIQLGILVGRWLRRYTPPAVFRVVVLCVLAFGGLDMLRRGVF